MVANVIIGMEYVFPSWLCVHTLLNQYNPGQFLLLGASVDKNGRSHLGVVLSKPYLCINVAGSLVKGRPP